MKLSKYISAALLSGLSILSGLSLSSRALDFVDIPLYLLNSSIPNMVLMLDDSGSMDFEILTRRHYDACAYQYPYSPSLSSHPISSSGQDAVCFYEGENYSGGKACYNSPQGNIGSWNDRWSSVRVRPGYGVRIYRHGSYSDGNPAVITNDEIYMPTGFDNQVSSFQLYQTIEPTNNCGSERTDGYLDRTGSNRGYRYLYGDGTSDPSLDDNYNLQDRDYFTSEFGDWRVFSSAFNVTYYDPDTEYTPWTSDFADASFTAARGHGVNGGPGYNSTLDLTGSFYAVTEDTAGFTGARPARDVNSFRSDANGLIDIWDNYTLYQINGSTIASWHVTYEVVDDELGRNIVKREERLPPITDPAQVAHIQQNFANWYQYARKRSFVVNGAISELVNTSPNYRYSYGLINKDEMLMGAPADNKDLAAHNSDLIDHLFTNYRASGRTPLREGLNRVGTYLQNKGEKAPITEACQQNFSLLFTDGYWTTTSFSHPNINDEDGDSYLRTVADIAHYYYSNDLRTDLDDRVPPSIFNANEHQHLVTFPVAFGVEGSLQDTDSDGWPDDGTQQLGESDDWGDPSSGGSNKINDLWHAAFNSKGVFSSSRTPSELVRVLKQALAEVDKRVGAGSSAAINTGSLKSHSRAYQAKYNSATWSGDLVALPFDSNGFVGMTPSWEAAAELAMRPANSRVIITSDFDTDGNLAGVPFRYNDDGISSPAYTSQLRTGMSALNIQGSVEDYLTAFVDFLRGDSANEGGTAQTNWEPCAFEGQDCTLPAGTTTTVRYGINGTYNTQVHSGTVSCTDGVFENPLPGVTVSKSCEYAVTQGYAFRTRNSMLGDLIHSFPVYVGPPRSIRLPSDTYSREEVEAYNDFTEDWSSRPNMVYVGGNDGMLHGFDADTGRERLAYVPYHLAGHLHHLANSKFSHKYFVDGQISVGDVCLGGASCAWRSMLVGGLRTGERAVYALNVTNPANFAESSASDIFMWEFSSEDDPDMGYFFGNPLIVKLSTGKSAVIISNGYNSDNGKAVLFILDAETGQPLAEGGKLDTQRGSVSSPNGLSSPTAVDKDGDGDVDFVYAGDLQGNLWKFDISSTDPSKWGLAYNYHGSPIPLYGDDQRGGEGEKEEDEEIEEDDGKEDSDGQKNAAENYNAITVAPVVGRHDTKAGFMIYFGTGKYIESIDLSSIDQPTQSFFGIWDDNRDDAIFSSSITSGDLLQQKILLEDEFYPFDTNGDGVRNSNDQGIWLRLTSNNRPCWGEGCPEGGESVHRGWQFKLIYGNDNRGEKQVTNPILRNGRIIFTTLLPSNDVCDRGGRSWLMELSAADGSSLYEPPFDFNNDGEFDADDVDYGSWGMVNTSDYCSDGQCQSPGGLMIDEIIQTPTIMSCGEGVECKYVSGSDGLINKINENPGNLSQGRQSWRGLWKE